MPTKPIGPKPTPVSAMGAFIYSNIPQSLSFQSQQWGCKSTERFQLFLLSHRAPGSQLWFQPHFCICVFHQHLLPRLPWNTQVGRERQRWVGCVSYSGECPSRCPWRRGAAHGEGGCSGGPTACGPSNNGTLWLWWPRLLPQTFPVVEFLTLIPSGCLFTTSSCPLTGSALQTLHSSTQPSLCTSKHTSQAEARGLWHLPPK